MSNDPKNYHKSRVKAILYSFIAFIIIVMLTAVLKIDSMREVIIAIVTGGTYYLLKPSDKDKPKGDKWA